MKKTKIQDVLEAAKSLTKRIQEHIESDSIESSLKKEPVEATLTQENPGASEGLVTEEDKKEELEAGGPGSGRKPGSGSSYHNQKRSDIRDVLVKHGFTKPSIGHTSGGYLHYTNDDGSHSVFVHQRTGEWISHKLGEDGSKKGYTPEYLDEHLSKSENK